MRPSFWASLAFSGAVVVACGGGVSLGNLGAEPGDAGPGSDGAGQVSDGSTGDGGAGSGCLGFVTTGVLDPSFRTCSSLADCVVVTYSNGCCVSPSATGVSASREAAVVACAAQRPPSFSCDCATQPTRADDGTTGADGGAPIVICNGMGRCETTFAGSVCGKNICRGTQTCCEGIPLPEPTCIDGNICPVSRQRYKTDIAYLSPWEARRLHDELVAFPLATYRYRTEDASERSHLGFVIDDVAPSAAVTSSGERVDMYGYQTMAVAAIQTQAREIALLRRQIEELRSTLRDPNRSPPP